MSEIWAKSNKYGGKPITLSQHIADALEVFKVLECKLPSGNSGLLRRAIQLAIICHDFGKAFPAFQMRTLRNKNYTPCHIYANLPHSLLSILLINQERLTRELGNYAPMVISSVAYHHWHEDFLSLILKSDKFGQLVSAIKRYIHEIEQNLVTELKKLESGHWTELVKFQSPFKTTTSCFVASHWTELVKFQYEVAEGLKSDVPFYKYALPPYQLYWFPERIEIDQTKQNNWVFIAGFLQRCDHFSSYLEEEQIKESPEIEPVGVKEVKKRVRIKLSNLKENEIWQLTKIDQFYGENLILVAPTGYGKTEFAFLWGGQDKFFYTLPVRSAVNQIYRRAEGIFGQGKTGMLHSDADVFLLADGSEQQTNFRSYDLARQLAFPAIIATGDQFFPYALRPPGFEKIYSAFSYSRLVVDEVQAYDPVSAAIVVKFIQDIVRMGGKFLLMTATLPSFIRDKIEESVGRDKFKEINIYEEEREKFKKMKKHMLQFILIKNSGNKGKDNKPNFGLPDKELIRILAEAKQGKRVLIVLNSVDQAQNVFQAIRNKVGGTDHYGSLGGKVWILHSRFTPYDRGVQEEILAREFSNPKPEYEKQGKILVATQVVEASLDLDADVLFTEVCPLDALVQRMGRVLRRYGPSTGLTEVPAPSQPNVYVWCYEEGLQSGGEYVYNNDLIALTLKIIMNGPLGAEKLNQWLIDWKRKGKELHEILGNSPGPVCISEFHKYSLVSAMYDGLPADGNYLRRYHETLHIVEAGYMSDCKNEAERMFRRIYDIPMVPSDRKEDLIRALIEFFNKYKYKDKEVCKGLYSSFKSEILSKFVVNVPVWQIADISSSSCVISWFYEREELAPFMERLKRWCSNIYFSGRHKYGDLGVQKESEPTDESGSFIF